MRNQQSELTHAELASYIGSTRQIMEKLFRVGYNVSNSIPSSSPNLKKLIKAEAESAILSNNVEGYPTRLLSSAGNIRANLNTLGENPRNTSAIAMKQIYDPKFPPLQAEATERAAQREQMIRDIREFIRDKDATIEEIVKAMPSSGRTAADIAKKLNKAQKKLDQAQMPGKSEEQILEALSKTVKKLNDLKSRNEKLVVNEVATQRKLDSLDNETTKAAGIAGLPVSKGEQPTIPSSHK